MVKKRGGKKVVSSTSNPFFVLLIIGLILFILQGIFIFGNILTNENNFKDIVGNVFIVCISSLALISSIMIYKKISPNFPREKKGKLFLSISIFLFFLGDLIWLFNEIFLKNLISFLILACSVEVFAPDIFSLSFFKLYFK